MTREEAIEFGKMWLEVFETDKDSHTYEFFDMAIKALEQETVPKESYEHEYFLRKEFEIKLARLEQQEPILDKIRAEVEALNQDYYCEGDFDKCKDYVLEIIDECRGYSPCDDCEHEGSFGKEFDDTCMQCKSGSNRTESR